MRRLPKIFTKGARSIFQNALFTQPLWGQKRGAGVGKTRCGNGSNFVAVADAHGLPVAIHVTSASPNEVTLVHDTLARSLLAEPPRRIIGDRAYDSDRLDRELAEKEIELISPHRSNKKNITQDGRPLRRYKRRWKAKRLFAWLKNFRRIAMRWDNKIENYLGFVTLGCIVLLFKRYV